ADRGYRTLVLSTDIAHSLADAFDLPLGPEPVKLAPRLWGQEPDVYFNIARYWHTIQAYVVDLFSWHGLDEVMAEEMTVLPGMDELGNLLWIADHVDAGSFDVIVVDAAPTGETLRLLSLPEASRWWVERIAPIGRRITRMGGPLLQKVIGVPIPKEEVFHAAERLLRRLEHLHRLLADPERTSVRMVLALEKLSIAEARRSFTYFHLFGYPSDLVIANRVLPLDAGGFFEGLRATQQRYLPEVEAEFGPVPVRTVPHFDREMVGAERLRELGQALYGEEDPTIVLYRGRPYAVRREAGGYVVSVELPFASKEAISLSRQADELVIGVGSWRRSLLLPRALIDARTKGAKMDGYLLQVEFEPRGDRTR
ncbi:MAG TPA: TRC40/GET3/ArsA family transport-energizing ATPase, partial [Candidatus Limnocylindrales bacterium]|nr:TRC40/GET3/ArsA family transport-energizing ATPase [Candidatus Limnocylindrales bacterium]